jgi:hypothetical protein
MDLFESIKKDLTHAYDEGVELAKKSTEKIVRGANTLTEEGKRMYQIFDLKIKAKAQMTELGGTVYRLGKKVENPMAHPKVKAIRNRIAKFEKKIQELEGRGGKKPNEGKAGKKAPSSARKADTTPK